jgi:hypothetical protein
MHIPHIGFEHAARVTGGSSQPHAATKARWGACRASTLACTGAAMQVGMLRLLHASGRGNRGKGVVTRAKGQNSLLACAS